MCDFELHCGDAAVEVAPSSQRLIAFLALQGRAVRRSFVSGTLWGDSTESRASASMRSALWRIPTAVRDSIVQASHTHIRLNPAVSVDLTRLAAEAVAALDGRIGEDDLIGAARELSACGDDVLAGWYDGWVMMERERFRELRLRALDELGARLLSRHRYGEALQVGLASVAAEPLRESAHRLLVRIHLGEGNVAAAIRQYRSYASLLAAELDVRPSPEMETLIGEHTASLDSSWRYPNPPTRDLAENGRATSLAVQVASVVRPVGARVATVR